MQGTSRKKGFTLIEVIVSLVLVSIIFLTLIQVLQLTSSIHQNSKRRENATNVAMSIYDLFYGDPLSMKTNLDFVYHSSSIEIIENDYRIFFDINWKSVVPLDQTAQYYVDVFLSEEDLKPTSTSSVNLIEITCAIQVFDMEKEMVLYVYDPAYSVVIREVIP